MRYPCNSQELCINVMSPAAIQAEISSSAPLEVFFLLQSSFLSYCLCFMFHIRRCVENAFGILSSRWRIFRRPLAESPKNAELLVLAACVLHNYLTSKAGQEDSFYCPHGYGDHVTPTGTMIDGAWRTEQEDSGLTSLGCTHARNPAESAKAVRELFTTYFLSAPGQLPWKKTQP